MRLFFHPLGLSQGTGYLASIFDWDNCTGNQPVQILLLIDEDDDQDDYYS